MCSHLVPLQNLLVFFLDSSERPMYFLKYFVWLKLGLIPAFKEVACGACVPALLFHSLVRLWLAVVFPPAVLQDTRFSILNTGFRWSEIMLPKGLLHHMFKNILAPPSPGITITQPHALCLSQGFLRWIHLLSFGWVLQFLCLLFFFFFPTGVVLLSAFPFLHFISPSRFIPNST